MPINIKEIFNSDLDSNSNSWWSQDKIDKINYNFNQFTSGGMSGPMGDQGSFGETGFIGGDGITGDQGPIGAQGYQGPRGDSEWVESGVSISGVRHLFPDKNEIQEYSPVVLGIGYLNPNSLNAFTYYDPVFNINKLNRLNNAVKVNNLKLVSDGIYSEHIVFREGSIDVYEEGRLFGAGAYAFSREILINPNSKFIFETLISSLKTNTISIGSNNIKIENVDLLVNNTFLASKDFFYENNAGEDKILQSINGLGNVQWVDKNSALPGFSYGMIISVPQFVFNSTNFELETVYTQTLNEDPIRFKYGRGKVGSQYEDWYLCNGQKWNTSPGINETIVPNLNILSISIDSNGNQAQISFNEAGSIISGYPIKTIATYSNLEYNIVEETTFTSNNVTIPIIIEPSSLNNQKTHDLTKMIYLVKLNRNDLEWEQSDAVADPTELISLNGPFTNPTTACLTTAAEVNYSWDGENWATFNSSSTNYNLYNFDTFSYAPSGWYEKNGITRYWNQSTGLFTDFSICVNYNVVNLWYGLGVSDVNGFVNDSVNTYLINTTDFTNATDLWNPLTNSSAAPGWYRFDLPQQEASLSTSSHRRYWNGTQFRGDTISRNWVYKLQTQPSIIKVANVSNGSVACSTFSTLSSHTIFFAYQFAPNSLPNNIYDLGNAEYKRWIFYVYQNWTEASIVGRGPLVNINSQSFPGSTDPASRVTHLIDGNGSIGNSTVAINSIVGGPLTNSGSFCL